MILLSRLLARSRNTILYVLCAIALLLCDTIKAQDRLEMGFMGGVSYYLGDLNQSQQFKSARPALGILVRYAINDRLAAKVNLFGGGIAGEYPFAGEKYPIIRPKSDVSDNIEGIVTGGKYEFSRMLLSVGFMGEVNFRSFDHVFNKSESLWTPYLTMGLGATFYKSYADKTSGKTDFVLSLPFGLGIKYKVNKWLRVGAEWTMHKTFADDLDLVDPNGVQINPNDPYGSKHHALTHNNDWVSFCGITITASMWPRKLSCNDGLKNYNK